MIWSLSFFIALVLVFAGYLVITFLARPIFVGGAAVASQEDLSKSRILLVGIEYNYSGAEIHLITLYKLLRKNGYHAVLLVPVNSKMVNYLNELGLPYYQSYALAFDFLRPLYHFILQRCLHKICIIHKISIIHSNNRTAMQDILAIKKQLSIKTVLTYHVLDPFATHKIKNTDAVVSVNPYEGMAYFEEENRKHSLNIRHIVHIPPLCESERFLLYVPTESRAVFFKKHFGLTLNFYPIITVVAQFYQDLSIKNHPMFLQVIHTLIYEKDKPVYVMLAGSGPRKAYLENLVKELSLQKFVHFLGFTDKIAGILHHSDMLVLPSGCEAFGMVYFEAGLMHKPSIGAYQTGAEAIIVHEKTGLLFKHNDAADLTKKIERLIDDKAFAQQLGNNAYEHIMRHFSSEVIFKKYEELYKII